LVRYEYFLTFNDLKTPCSQIRTVYRKLGEA
jgi:hypothetical protein